MVVATQGAMTIGVCLSHTIPLNQALSSAAMSRGMQLLYYAYVTAFLQTDLF